VFLVRDAFIGAHNVAFELQIDLWLWFTVLSPLRRAMAEARARPKRNTLRKTQTDALANRVRENGRPSSPVFEAALRNVVICSEGELIPGDATSSKASPWSMSPVITGESAPVIRESGGDRSAVTGGTKVLSDQVRIKITSTR